MGKKLNRDPPLSYLHEDYKSFSLVFWNLDLIKVVCLSVLKYVLSVLKVTYPFP